MDEILIAGYLLIGIGSITLITMVAVAVCRQRRDVVEQTPLSAADRKGRSTRIPRHRVLALAATGHRGCRRTLPRSQYRRRAVYRLGF